MKYLYKFEWEFRRGGNVEGLFIADEEEVDSAIGKQYILVKSMVNILKYMADWKEKR